MQYTIGIDEAGRGPLAGPVAVGAVIVKKNFDTKLLTRMRDSKQVSERVREELFAELLRLKKVGVLDFAFSFSSATRIDTRGIVPAIRDALTRTLEKLNADPQKCQVLLDGSLYAPSSFLHQETIIRGDATEPLISAASIVAKVMRDRYMVRLSKSFPEYDFDVHKGYGTLRHRTAIRTHGLSRLHRATFCKSLHVGRNTV